MAVIEVGFGDWMNFLALEVMQDLRVRRMTDAELGSYYGLLLDSVENGHGFVLDDDEYLARAGRLKDGQKLPSRVRGMFRQESRVLFDGEPEELVLVDPRLEDFVKRLKVNHE